MKAALKGALWGALLVGLIFGGLLAFQQQQTVKDFFAARNFEPSLEIAQITNNLLLTDTGKRTFYATAPEILDREEFSQRCLTSIHPEEGALLGCYSDDRINLFQIDDDRLSGIMEVTSAHELLHAAYARLTNDELASVQSRLLQLYDELSVADPEFKKRMALYSDLSEAGFANELHSVFGTEVRDLPEWLEKHYKRWFSDRNVILAFYDSYSEYFIELQQKGEELIAELEALSDRIDEAMLEYSAAVQLFNSDFEFFVARNEAFEFSESPELFYSLKASFESRRAEIEGSREEIERLVAEHDALREEIQNLNLITKELRQIMNSALPDPDS